MSRQTLVLLHAFGASAKAWDPVIDKLDSQFDIVALDLPGFGGAPDHLHAQSVHDYAAWVADQIAVRRLTQFVLVGWSMGAKIALACALRRPDGLQSLILVAPSPPGPEPMTPDARQAERNAFKDPPAARKALQQVAGDDFDGAPLASAVADRMAAHRSAWDFWLDVGSKEDITKAVEGLTLPNSGHHRRSGRAFGARGGGRARDAEIAQRYSSCGRGQRPSDPSRGAGRAGGEDRGVGS